MPYTTNGQFVKAAPDRTKVIAMLKLAAFKYAHQVSYAFVQPMMFNKKEYRVVVLGGQARYVAHINKGANGNEISYSVCPHVSLFHFAENAVKALKLACPSTLSDFLLRVDIFQRNDSRLVVNEFESLEACIYSKSHAREEAPANIWMSQYWLQKLNNFVCYYNFNYVT